MVHFFAAMLFGSPAYLGWDPTVQLVRDPSSDSAAQYDYTVEDADGTQTVYRTLESISKQSEDRGMKSLRVWKAVEVRDGNPVGDPVVLKEMWRFNEIAQEGSNTRAVSEPTPTSTLSEEAQERLTRGVLTVLHHGDVIIRPDPSKPQVSFADRLPMHFNTFGKSVPPGLNILTGRRARQNFWTGWRELSDRRIHYRMVVKELCTPMYEIRWRPDKVVPALAQICEGALSFFRNLFALALVSTQLTRTRLSRSFPPLVLRCVHQKGWVHHDISYGNILIDSDGQARLSDFEFAEKYADKQTSYRVVRSGAAIKGRIFLTSSDRAM